MTSPTATEADNYLVGGTLPAALRDILSREDAHVAEVVRKWVEAGLDQLYLVGCGGSLAVMHPAKYLIDRYSTLAAEPLNGWEFVNRAPRRLDARSAAVLASHSGKTPEVLRALELAESRGARTLSFSLPDTELDRRSQEGLTYQSTAANQSKLLMAYLVAAHTLVEAGDATVGRELLAALRALPELTERVVASSEARGRELAEKYRDEKGYYVVGTGLLAGLAYQFRTCTLLEMQWLHSAMINAGELAHGPLEIVDRDVPFIVLAGTDEGRDTALHAHDFIKRYSDKVLLFDLAEIAPDANPMLAPFLVHVALQWFAWHLSLVRHHPLSVRRYMGKVAY